MGRICPILNHPLNDGVLIEDEALVHFIQKRNLDFLPQELVCRTCKHEVTKLYNKKLKKAIELHRSRYHEGSVSSVKTSKNTTSSGASTTSEHSVSLKERRRKDVSAKEITQNVIVSSVSVSTIQQQNDNIGNTSGDSNQSGSSKAENQINLANTQNSTSGVANSTGANNFKNVTIRKRTIKDFLTAKPKEIIPHPGKRVSPRVQNKPESIRHTRSSVTKKPLGQHVTYDTILENVANNEIRIVSRESTAVIHVPTNAISNSTPRKEKTFYNSLLANNNDDDDVNRRLSQEPTTSKAAAITNSTSSMVNSNKRPISEVIDSDDDNEDNQRLSLNAYNGTRLPHIQPIPPKRKPQPDQTRSIARDIMDDYIKDITGG